MRDPEVEAIVRGCMGHLRHDEEGACADCIATALRAAREAERERWEAEVARLRGALTEIMALIDEGWLVRNTTNDAHFPSYLRESARLVNALSAAQAALAALRREA